MTLHADRLALLAQRLGTDGKVPAILIGLLETRP